MIYGWLYRTLMKLAHRYNWHHAPVIGPISGSDTWRYQRWCQWCGLRESYRYDPRERAKLGAILEGRKLPEGWQADIGAPKLTED